MNDKDNNSSMPFSDKPIWYSPVWLTAIVGVISVFLTIPGIIGAYLTKQQDIEIAKQKTESIRLGNIESKQEQEFKIVNNTLAQQGSERVFVLRYLSFTLDDPDAKIWAKGEVHRLDDLAKRQEALDKVKIEFSTKERELRERISKGVDDTTTTLTYELENLQIELAKQNSEVSEIQKNAGITKDEDETPITLFRIKRNPDYKGKGNALWIKLDDLEFDCIFEEYYCESYIITSLPEKFSIVNHERNDLKYLMFGYGIDNSKVSYDFKLAGQIVIKQLNEYNLPYAGWTISDKEVHYKCNRDDQAINCILK